MNLRNTLAYLNIDAAVAGTQATHADPRSADEWIKKWLDQKNKRLNDLRQSMHKLLDFPQEVQAAYREDKKSAFEQNPKLVASGGNWAVVSPEDEIISTWDTKEEAEAAANPAWRGIRPSNGPTLGARVKKVSEVKAGGPGSGCRGENCGRPELYHGTSKQFINKILKEGLVGDDAVYATRSKAVALRYAIDRGKTAFLRSKKGKRGSLAKLQVAVVVLKPEAEKEMFQPGNWVYDAKRKRWSGAAFSRTNVPSKYIDRVEIFPYESVEKYYESTAEKPNEELKPLRVIKAEEGEFYIGLPIMAEEIQAADIFVDEEHGDRTRSQFLKHPKPQVVQDADKMRMGDMRPSSHGQGSAGTGGAAGPSGGGSGTS